MLIWVVKIGEPLPVDQRSKPLRTGILASTLIERGHRVVWWASGFDHYKKKMVYPDHGVFNVGESLEIRTVRGTGYGRNISFRRYLDHALLARKMCSWMKTAPAPDVIIVSMPDYRLATVGVSMAREKGCPVFIDIRDKWPDLFWEMSPPLIQPLVKMVFRGDRNLLARTLRGADGIISVTETWLDWGLGLARRARSPFDKVVYLGCPPMREGALKNVSERILDLKKRTQGKFVITFIGSFSRIHDPRVVAQAAIKINLTSRLADKFFFVFAGEGALKSSLSRLVGKETNCSMPGWLDAKEIEALMSISSLGLVPFGFSTDFFPNKAFTYLSAGVPVLTSAEGDLKKLIEDYNAGSSFPWNDSGELANLIETLYVQKERYSHLRAGAKRLFDEKLNSNLLYSSYVRHIETSVSELKRSASGQSQNAQKIR